MNVDSVLVLIVLLQEAVSQHDSGPRNSSCFFSLDGIKNTVRSLGFPNSYPPNSDCVYELVRPSVEFCGVRLLVEYLDLEPSTNPEYCNRDWLEFQNCVPLGSSRLCGTHSGNVYQFIFQEDATSIALRFHSNESVQGRGFVLHSTMLKACNGPFTEPVVSLIPGMIGVPCYTKIYSTKGSIYTPDYPKPYPTNLDCVYEFVRPNPYICGIEMRSLSFSLEPPLRTSVGVDACVDFLHTPGCHFVCGRSKQLHWIVRYQKNSKAILFHFHSDESPGDPGFFIDFNQVYDCSHSVPFNGSFPKPSSVI